jgi:hypothetical protein
MKLVHKFKLEGYSSEQICYMPRNSKILSVQLQNGEVYIWALIDTSEVYIDRTCM